MFESNADDFNILEFFGDDEAVFDNIFTRFFPKVKSFILGFCGDADTADDIAQDIFMRMWIKRNSLSHVKNLKSYMYAAARNAALVYIKKSLRESSFRDANEREEGNTEPATDNIYYEELRNIIKREIENMPEQRRRVFIMSRVDGLSNQDISERLKISKRTVEAHISLALAELHKIIPLFVILSFFNVD